MISLIRQIINPSNQLKNIVNSVKPVIKPIAPQQNSQTDVEETSETKKASYRMAKLIMVTPNNNNNCLLYTSPSPRDLSTSRMPSSA